jgi:hypothetical protein
MLTSPSNEADDGATAEPETRADLPDGQTGRPAFGEFVAQSIEILPIAMRLRESCRPPAPEVPSLRRRAEAGF